MEGQTNRQNRDLEHFLAHVLLIGWLITNIGKSGSKIQNPRVLSTYLVAESWMKEERELDN